MMTEISGDPWRLAFWFCDAEEYRERIVEILLLIDGHENRWLGVFRLDDGSFLLIVFLKIPGMLSYFRQGDDLIECLSDLNPVYLDLAMSDDAWTIRDPHIPDAIFSLG